MTVDDLHKYEQIIQMITRYPYAGYYYCKKYKIDYSKHVSFENIKLPGSIHFESFSPSYGGFKDNNFQQKVQLQLALYSFERQSTQFQNIFFRTTFLTDKSSNIINLYSYLGQFESTNKDIIELLRRERIWSKYEKTIILNKYGHYSIDYITFKYGKTDISLSQYEEILSNLNEVNEFINKLEAPFHQMQKKYPSAIEEFEKLHPEIPHKDYLNYESEINEIAIKCKTVLYDKYQSEITTNIGTYLSNKTDYHLISNSVDFAITDFSGQKKKTKIPWCITFRKYLYEGILDNAEKCDYYRCKYPHCADMFVDLDEDSKEANIINFISSITPSIVKAYQTRFVQLTIVLPSELEEIGIKSENIYRILEKENIKTKNIEVISETFFKYNFQNHIPYLFISLIDNEVTLRQKVKELTSSNLLFSFITLYYVIDFDSLISVNETRIKKEEKEKNDYIQNLRRKYPHGFSEICAELNITEQQYLSYYDKLQSSVSRMQNAEDRHADLIIINKAKTLISKYPNASRNDGYCSSNLSRWQAEKVLSSECKWKEIESIYYGRKNIFNTGYSLNGIPHKYFYKYYPESRYSSHEIDILDINNRQLIWDFKDGRSYATAKVTDMVCQYLDSIKELCAIANRIVFTCAPASNQYAYENRFRIFSDSICQKLGYLNAYEHLHIASYSLPKHRGGSGDIDYNIDPQIFKDNYIILFDDIVTSGETILSFARRIEQINGKIIAIISIGKTV